MATAIARDQARRQRILVAARRVFERKGLAQASMRAIAKEAACTTGAIYPLFEGKEHIYACLLEESLEQLHASVASACAVRADAMEALCAASSAWHEYYLNHPFEAELGLYLHGTGGIRGVGRNRDQKLNALLLKTLDIFAACFRRLAPAAIDADKMDTWARNERDAHFAQLIGILMLARSGRARSIATNADTVLETSLHALRNRLASS